MERGELSTLDMRFILPVPLDVCVSAFGGSAYIKYRLVYSAAKTPLVGSIQTCDAVATLQSDADLRTFLVEFGPDPHTRSSELWSRIWFVRLASRASAFLTLEFR